MPQPDRNAPERPNSAYALPSNSSEFKSNAAYLEAQASLAHVGSFACSPLEEDASPSPVYFIPKDKDFHNAWSLDQSTPRSSHHSSNPGFYPRPREKPLPAIAVEYPNDIVAIKRARDTMAAFKSREERKDRAELLANQPTESETDEYWKNLAFSCEQKSGTDYEFSSHWTGLAYTQYDAYSNPGGEDRLQNQRIESWEGGLSPFDDDGLTNVNTLRPKPLTSIRPSREASVFTEKTHSSVIRSSDDQDDSKIVVIPKVARGDNGITTISSEESSTRPVEKFDVSSSSEAISDFQVAASTMNDGSSKARKRTRNGCLSS